MRNRFANLRTKILQKKAKIVVIGMGYVGIPLAASFAREDFNVIGYDIDQEKVNSLNKGIYPIKGNELGMPELIEEVVTVRRKLAATTNQGVLNNADIIVVVVDTPLKGQHPYLEPDTTNLIKACQAIGKHIKKGSMVIVESTLAPGTTQGLIAKTIEKESGLAVGTDFALAHCPERVMPGRLIHNLTSYPRIMGGVNKESSILAKLLYENIVDAELFIASTVEAEIAKTAENSYRAVRIAFANLLAIICQIFGANFWTVKELIESYPGRKDSMLEAGAGVGGHCIPKDLWLLMANTPAWFKKLFGSFLSVTSYINNKYMPANINNILNEFYAEGRYGYYACDIAVLGYSYLPESGDDRNSPTARFLKIANLPTHIRLHDPYTPHKNMKAGMAKNIAYSCNKAISPTWREAVAGADAVIFMVAHKEYVDIDLEELKSLMNQKGKPLIIDGRNIFDKETARALGFNYRGVGNCC